MKDIEKVAEKCESTANNLREKDRKNYQKQLDECEEEIATLLFEQIFWAESSEMDIKENVQFQEFLNFDFAMNLCHLSYNRVLQVSSLEKIDFGWAEFQSQFSI